MHDAYVILNNSGHFWCGWGYKRCWSERFINAHLYDNIGRANEVARNFADAGTECGVIKLTVFLEQEPAGTAQT